MSFNSLPISSDPSNNSSMNITISIDSTTIPVDFSNSNNSVNVFSGNSNDASSSVFIRRHPRRTIEQIQQIKRQQHETQAKIEELEQKKEQLQLKINTLRKKNFTSRSNEEINHVFKQFEEITNIIEQINNSFNLATTTDNYNGNPDFINSFQEQQSFLQPASTTFVQNYQEPSELTAIPRSTLPSIHQSTEIPSISRSPIQRAINTYLHQPLLWPHEKHLLANLHKFLSRKTTNSMFEFRRTNSDSCLELELLVKPEAKQSSCSKKFSTLFINLFCIYGTNSFDASALQHVKSIEGQFIVNLFLPEDDGDFFTPQILLLDLKNGLIVPSTSYVTVNHNNGYKFLSIKLPLQQQDNFC